MHGSVRGLLRLSFLLPLLIVPLSQAYGAASWHGVLRDASGNPIAGETVKLRSESAEYIAKTSANGAFAFSKVAAGEYQVSVRAGDQTYKLVSPVVIAD